MDDEGFLQNGKDFLLGVIAYFDTEASLVPFKNYLLAYGQMLDESWDDQRMDESSPKINVKYTSGEGSTIQYVKTTTGNEQSGTLKDGLDVVGKNDGYKFSTKVNNNWSSTGYESSTVLQKSYTAGTVAKDDDSSYEWTLIEKNNYKSGAFTRSTKFGFSSGTFSYNETSAINSKYIWGEKRQELSYDKGTTLESRSIADSSKKISLSEKIKIDFDTVADVYKFSISNHKIETEKISLSTPSFGFTTDKAGISSLPATVPDAAGSDPEAMSDAILQIANPQDLEISIWKFNNIVMVKSTDGAEVNLGGGNDKATGALGPDTISAGAGKDTIAGGKGNDTFILSIDDYDFSSAKALMVDTITDFKFIPGKEQDSLILDGFDSVGVYSTINDAKKLKASETVIYESKTGKFWYNEDNDSALIGALNFATVKGIPQVYWDSV